LKYLRKHIINNYLRNKLAVKLLGKRCLKCYSAYTEESVLISQQYGFTEKQRFMVDKKSGSKTPIYDTGRRPIKIGEWADLFTTRYIVNPTKARMHVVVGSISMCCGRCGYCKETLVDVQNLR
jgi:hypothetical protein